MRVIITHITHLFFGACVLLFALSFSVDAQEPKKIHRIGYVVGGDTSGDITRLREVRLALHQFGYIEGKNITIEYRSAQGKLDRLPELAADLVALNVDIIVAAGGHSVINAAKSATRSIPIVMAGGGIDPVESGLVESLARPGGNVTGLTLLSGELGGKRLELLKEAVPKLVHVAVFYDPSLPGPVREVTKVLPVAARGLGLTTQPLEIRAAADFEKAFAALTKDRPDGVYTTVGPLMTANGKRVARFALKNRLPSVYTREDALDAGGLIYYGAVVADSYRRVAAYIDRILKGAKPAELPIEQPTKFELVVNLKTAKQIGLKIPPNVLGRADRVIR